MQFRLRRPLMGRSRILETRPLRQRAGHEAREALRSVGLPGNRKARISGRNRNAVLYIFPFEEPNLRAAWRFAGNKEKMSG
jgi:hypothetical protein